MSQGPNDRQQQTRLRALSAALHGRGITILHQGQDRLIDLAENLPAVWPQPDMIGRRETEFLPPSTAQHFAQAYDLCRSSGEPQMLEFELIDGNRHRQFEAELMPDADGITTVITDVTDERGREATLASLLREVSHRSKNLLAIVQSVAMQTAHHSGGIEDFLAKFRGRLHALSSTQDLVTESNWRGTYLQSLVASQVTRVGHAALANMRITGANPLLGPNASLHIGLAIHELAANAVLHGALAQGNAGNVWVDAHLADQPLPFPDLVIDWQETGIDAQRARQEPRFGTLVLERIVPLSVGGTAEFTITGDSVHYRLTVPADQFET
jgi:two-component sensor histidine kinase